MTTQTQQATQVGQVINSILCPPTLSLISSSRPTNTDALAIRQSLLNDYLTCPQLAYYTWVLRTQEYSPFMAALLGNAGHSLISSFHSEDNFAHTRKQLESLFILQCNIETERLSSSDQPLPLPGRAFTTLSQQFKSSAPLYAEMLYNYCQDKRNQDFSVVINEQTFVVKLNYHFQNATYPIIFTGTIDQAGYYKSSGQFCLRDIKFRDDAFRPTDHLLKLNKQLALYSVALKYGVPSCKACSPKPTSETVLTQTEFATIEKLEYNSPCSSCLVKLSSRDWPCIFPDESQLIWMRGYTERKKDQFKKYTKDKTRKVPSPASRRMVYPDVINPKWLEGYKTGDLTGEPIIVTTYTRDELRSSLQEMCEISMQIKSGIFYRKPGEHCSSWCHHTSQCISDLTPLTVS